MGNKDQNRILTFDLLRGYFLLALLLNHLQRYPNGFDWMTMRGQLFISPAEGFFFISGIILGIVRGHKLRDVPFIEAAKLLWKRSGVLYLWAVGLTVAFTLIGWYFIDAPRLKPGIMSPDASLWHLAWQSISLQYVYGWADFLRLYAVFLFAAPGALWLLRHRKWWAIGVISAALYVAFPESVFARWQPIFFSGFVGGYYWHHVEEWWNARQPLVRYGTLGCLLLVVGVTAVANIMIVFGPSVFSSYTGEILAIIRDSLTPYFNKETMEPARFMLTTLWFVTALLAVRQIEHRLPGKLVHGFLVLGQNSLYVYIVHSILVFGLDLVAPTRQVVLNVTLTLVTLICMYLLVKRQVGFRFVPR